MREIKIEDAKEISEKSGYRQIIILGIEPNSGRQRVATYGETKGDAINAANVGNWLKRKLGWDEKECHDMTSVTVLEAKDE
jgi:hypothetical protein